MIRHAHFYWGNTELPWLHSLSIKSFMKQHPGWRMTLWRPPALRRCAYQIAAPVSVEALGCDVAIADPQDRTGAMLVGYDHNSAWLQTAWSDALRLWCLHEFGGLYSDCDVLWFRKVENSSLDGPGLRVQWDGDLGLANSLIAAGEREHPTLGWLLKRIREMSPVKQDPGGDTPFGAHLWRSIPREWRHGIASFRTGEFQQEPFSVAMHFRAARVLWGGLTPDNWRERTADVPGLAQAIEWVL